MAPRSLAKKLFHTFARVIPQCGMVSQAVAFNMFLAFFPILLVALGSVSSSLRAKSGQQLAVELSEILPPGTWNDLADRVEPVCLTVGDWAGFDVRTFDAKTGEEIHIEVKTTTGPARTPFFMSTPEVEYAKSCKCQYKIYRVYEYRADAKEVRFFVIDNANDALQLTPTQYRVRLK